MPLQSPIVTEDFVFELLYWRVVRRIFYISVYSLLSADMPFEAHTLTFDPARDTVEDPVGQEPQQECTTDLSSSSQGFIPSTSSASLWRSQLHCLSLHRISRGISWCHCIMALSDHQRNWP